MVGCIWWLICLRLPYVPGGQVPIVFALMALVRRAE